MREKTVDILNLLHWSVQVPTGLVKGEYYRAEARFNPHPEDGRGKEFLGVLEVVQKDGRLVQVEFDEFNSPCYYIRKYQNVSKRYSGYGFLQASRERTAKTHVVLVNGIAHAEQQMLRENRLTGEFDLLTGASNSIRQGMLPLANTIAQQMEGPAKQLYYGLAREVEPGVTGRLQVVLRANKIVRVFYDEIFADSPDEIASPELKDYYRQSKYHSLEYISAYPCGFNAQVDALAKRVVETQDLLDIKGLLFAEGSFRQEAWGSYLEIAGMLQAVIQADGVLPRV